MRKFLILLIFGMLIGKAQAEGVPLQLKKSLQSYRINNMTLQKEVLKIQTKYSVVTYDIYKSMAQHGICLSLWLDKKKGWGKANFKRVEILNDIGKQGFAMIGGRNTCNELGKFTGEQGQEQNEYLYAHTWVCVAGICHQRQPGERINGDK